MFNEEFKEEFLRFGFKVEDVEEVFGVYFFFDGEWRQMFYFYFVFEVKFQIEVGVILESYYFVVVVLKEKISEDFFEVFFEVFLKSFIYGSEDFFNDVYNCMRDSFLLEEIIKRIYESFEKVFQFEVNFDDVEKFKEGFFKVIEFGKCFEIFDF